MSAHTSDGAGLTVAAGELQHHYRERRAVVAGLVRQAGDDLAASTDVPACPEWTVRDTLAHLTGLCADVLAGNIGGAGSDEWTAAQVETRSSQSASEILAEWDEVAEPFAAVIDSFPGWYGRQIVADLTVHEHDIRGALGQPGDRDSTAVVLGLDFALSARAHCLAAALGLGPVEFLSDGRSWVIGSSTATEADVDSLLAQVALSGERPAPSDEPRVRVEAGAFELIRALTGRRSERQIRGYAWSADPSPYLELFASPLFSMRATDLDE